MEARQRKKNKDAVQNGQRCSAEPKTPSPQHRCTACDQPDGSDVSNDLHAGNVVAPGLKWLMAGVEPHPK